MPDYTAAATPRLSPALRAGSLVLVFASLALGACGAPAARHTEAAPLPPPQTQVYFYPTRGQTSEQQDRDRYECYRWAKKQTGFDPSDPQLAPHQRFVVVPATPPGQDVAAGAVTGAIVGAVVSRPGHQAEGAAVGAIAGATLGAAAESSRQHEAARRTKNSVNAQLELQAANYRRALTACLEGRGYTVR